MLTAAVVGAKLMAYTPFRTMPEDQFKAFQAAVEADAGLLEQLKAVTDPDAVVAIAKAAGFVISVEDVARAYAEILEDELAGVTGGFETSIFASTYGLEKGLP